MGIAASSSLPLKPQMLNRKLNIEPVQSLSTKVGASVAARSSVVCVLFCPPNLGNVTVSDDSNLYRVLVVTQNCIEEFCLITGNRGARVYQEDTGRSITAAKFVHTADAAEKGILVCNDVGRVRLVDVDSMKSKMTLDMSVRLRPENDEITAIFYLERGNVAFGHKNGLIEVLSIGGWEAKGIFNDATKRAMPGVLRLAYWKKGKMLLSGHKYEFVSAEGAIVTLESYEIRLYSVDFSAENELIRDKSSELPGFIGNCLDLSVIDSQNLAVALSSVNSRVFIWSLQSKKLIFSFNIPPMTEKITAASCFSIIPQPGNSAILVFGMNDGTAIVSKLSLKEDLRLNWTPLKLIKEKGAQSDSKRGITTFEFDEVIDMLAIGDRQGRVRLINNFEWELEGKDEGRAPEEAQAERTPPKAAESKQDRSNPSGFARYLHERKEVLQVSRPDLPYKDLLISITEEWQHMSADARLTYNRSLADINTPV